MTRHLLIAAGLCALGAACNESRPLPSDTGTVGKEGGLSDAKSDRAHLDAAIDRMLPDTRPRPPAKWEKAPSMASPRRNPTATSLLDGSVLVAGGRDWDPTASAERFDPVSNTWSPAGTMSTPHWAHQAVLLKDGRVLVVGGCQTADSYFCMDDVGADLYDPTTNSWKKAASMFTTRRGHALALLQDGRVLMAGGNNGQGPHHGLEIYDPGSNVWSSPASTLSAARTFTTATTLKNGKVLIVAGWNADKSFHKTLEVFDPATGAVAQLSALLAEERAGHTATLLEDGRVLIVGGYCHLNSIYECVVKNAEIYDPVSDKVVGAGSIGTGLYEHAATLLQDGRVLITGGSQYKHQSAIFDSKQMSWTQGPSLLEPRSLHASARLGERVLVAGGLATMTSGSTLVEIFTPERVRRERHLSVPEREP